MVMTSILLVSAGNVLADIKIPKVKQKVGEHVPLSELKLNRKIRPLSEKDRNKHVSPDSHYAFRFNKKDQLSVEWYPQGIAVIDKDHVAVTWHSDPLSFRKDKVTNALSKNIYKRGAKVSIVNTKTKKYRNILFVDKDYKTYPRFHAGGMTFKDGILYVADSRKEHKTIRAFPLSSIQKINYGKGIKLARKAQVIRYQAPFYGFGTVIQEDPTKSFKVDGIKPSYISYDPSQKMFVSGNWKSRESAKQKPADVAWFSEGFKNVKKTNSLGSVQGAATNNGMMYLSQSYCPENVKKYGSWLVKACKKNDQPSVIRYGKYETLGSTPDFASFKELKIKSRGLQDLGIDKTTLWSVTEFGGLGKKNRIVFAVKQDKLKP